MPNGEGPMTLRRLRYPFTAVQVGPALAVLLATFVASFSESQLPADEGMWLFNHPPCVRLEEKYGVTLTPSWLLHLQQSSVRFNSGGSGSFVSANGLVLTNHHVGADSLQKLGDASHNYYRDGFMANSPQDEVPCHDLELNVLISITDVTARVQAAVEPGLEADAAFAARRRVMAEIEKESLLSTGLRSDTVTLYQGGQYHLYRSKKYTDVRLVFAPEQQIAFFGGDADNFEFPRYNLDICFFRAYENGLPAKVAHHLAWSRQPIANGDLVFVSGHPGHTDRANTISELIAMRDHQIPFSLAVLHRLEVMLTAYSAKGPEQARQAMGELFGVQNSRKAREGLLAGLLDPAIMRRRQAREHTLRESVSEQETVSPWNRIAQAQADSDRVATRYRLLEAATGFNSQYFLNARTILRAAAEFAKPNGDRLREYRDSNRESLELQLFSKEPIYDAFEIVKLTDSLTFLVTSLGADDPLVQAVMCGQSPQQRAEELVQGTTLGHRSLGSHSIGSEETIVADTRRLLMDGGTPAVAASDDPMIVLARFVDADARAARQVIEASSEIKQQSHAEIGRAIFLREGTAVYPDATFTLRLAYGTVRGVPEKSGPRVSKADGLQENGFVTTTFSGLFERATAQRNTPPFHLPDRWKSLLPRLEHDETFLKTPLNFISTVDIIGGNSGSPVVNRDGKLVGLIFDGNIDSLVLDIMYDDTRARAVSVAAVGIIAALRQVYDATPLLREIDNASGSSD